MHPPAPLLVRFRAELQRTPAWAAWAALPAATSRELVDALLAHGAPPEELLQSLNRASLGLASREEVEALTERVQVAAAKTVVDTRGIRDLGAGAPMVPPPQRQGGLLPTTMVTPLPQGSVADTVGSPPVQFESDRLKMGRRLGAGGMAEVFLAVDTTTGQAVAVKRMAAELEEDDGFLQRFLREVKNATHLNHPNIMRVWAYGQYEGTWCMVCEYLDAGTVTQLLRRAGPLPTAVAVTIAHALLSALLHAHDRSVIHRDIKPANILLGMDGAVKLGDFGIAKGNTDVTLTATAALIGTPAYMSPEQAAGAPLDFRSDLFSAGTVIYEMVTGTNPFVVADNLGATMRRVLEADVPPILESAPAVHPRLESVLHGLMALAPAQRFASAREALALLEPLVEKVRQQDPHQVARFFADPARAVAPMRAAEAQREFERGRRDWAIRPTAAALSVYRASVLAPDNPEVAAVLAQVCAQTGTHFGAVVDPRLVEATATSDKAMKTPGPAKRAADMLRAAGYLHAASLYLRRYLALKPQDSHARLQLTELLGPDLTPPHLASADGASVTQQLMAGIVTGGFKAGPVVASAGQGVTGAAPAAAPVVEETVPPVTDQLRELWQAHRNRFITVGVLLVAGLLAVRWVGRFIDRSVTKVQAGLADTTQKVADGTGGLTGGSPLLDAERSLRAGDAEGAVRGFSAVIASERDERLLGRAYLGRARAHASNGRKVEARADAKAAQEKIPSGDAHRPEVDALLKELGAPP